MKNRSKTRKSINFKNARCCTTKMKLNRQIFVTLCLAGVVFIAVAALPSPGHQFRNLRVLPKDISSKDLSRIMVDEFEDGLGVSCAFCHAQSKDSVHLDYASGKEGCPADDEDDRGHQQQIF